MDNLSHPGSRFPSNQENVPDISEEISESDGAVRPLSQYLPGEGNRMTADSLSGSFAELDALNRVDESGRREYPHLTSQRLRKIKKIIPIVKEDAPIDSEHIDRIDYPLYDFDEPVNENGLNIFSEKTVSEETASKRDTAQNNDAESGFERIENDKDEIGIPDETEEPAASEEPAVVEEPIVVEESRPVDEPVVVEESLPVEEAVVVEESLPVEEPVVIEELLPVDEPVVVEESLPVEEPVVVEESLPVEEPAVVEESLPVDEPVVVEESLSVDEPVVVEESLPVEEPAVVEEPLPVDEPVVVEESLPVDEPAVVEESMPVDEPVVVEESLPVDEPAVVEESLPVDEPAVVEESMPVDEPAVVEESLPVEEPVSPESFVREISPVVQTSSETIIITSERVSAYDEQGGEQFEILDHFLHLFNEQDLSPTGEQENQTESVFPLHGEREENETANHAELERVWSELTSEQRQTLSCFLKTVHLNILSNEKAM